MEVPSGSTEEPRGVRIVGSELVENYTVYVIRVFVGVYHWTVKHRYSEFFDLHEKLTVENKIDKNLLPPKKMIGKNSKSLVERRQKDLEVYLQTLLSSLPVAVPRALALFLDFHLYEIHGIAAVLAEELFHTGEQLLVLGEVFTLKPLQLYAVTQLLQRAKPTCVTGDAKTDLGHILDFMCRLKYLKITGTRGMVGTSNIEEQKLSYDLSVFKSLCQIEVSHCSAEYITGLTSCKKTLETMSFQFSASSMKDILVPEAREFDQWEPEGTSAECPITAVIPKWKMLRTLDMSHNSITCIDNSLKLIPQIEYLDLSHNDISSVDNLQHLYNLIHLDLSYNKIWDLSTSHTKVGNIKTLNLAGNLLHNLSGLNKLYSLVNLDLSNNKIEQLEEINNIGKLPCLENVNLTNNPVTIIPDYRTKVLAQFGDRASEVCLDTMLTTRKELDTVEVLKAIQKSKEAKHTLNMSEKTMSVESRLTAGSSKTICSSLPANASSPSKSRPVNANQVLRDAGLARLSSSCCWTPGNYGISPRSGTIQNSALEGKQQLHPRISQPGAVIQDGTSVNNGEKFPMVLPTVHNTSCSCISYCDSDLIAHFSTSIVQMLNQPPDLPGEKSDSKGNLRSSEPGDGYFEMGLKEENQSDGNAPDPLRSNLETVTITQFLLSFSIRFSGVLAPMQFVSCFVLTDTSIALFEIPFKAEEPSHQPPPSLKLVLCFSYDDLTELAFIIPEMCLSLKVRNGEDYLFVLSDSQKLGEFYGCLRSRCSQRSSPDCSPLQREENMSLHSFLVYLCRVHQVSGETGEIQGCFPVCLFHSDEKIGTTQQDFVIEKEVWTTSSPCAAVYSSIRSALVGDKTPFPSLLFLLKQHMILMKIDFSVIPGTSPKPDCMNNFFHLSKIPLACVLLHPVLNPDGHRVQLIMDYRSVTTFFVFPHDKLRFLTGYNSLRNSLQHTKNILISRSLKYLKDVQDRALDGSKLQLASTENPQAKFSQMYSSEGLLHKLSEDNQIPFYLPVVSPLHFISELNGGSVVEFFHSSVAEVENEELRHLMWSSVVFYTNPDMELSSCVLLSTNAVYFLLDNSLKQINSEDLDFWKTTDCERCAFHLSSCLMLKLSDLLSVNIGLFDQYFRLTGPSPDHIVTCLTRDGYSTHAFIQHLMSALSLRARTPSPEPLEKDFYSEFGNKNTGKMENFELIHSSRVKFIYPNEEEIGDITFLVSEKMVPPGPLQSLNILLYVLGFHVSSVDAQEALLQPKTLILTNSELFLFNEDYINYPLPDFAKEPPKTDKYQLIDGRRIRDLDRVLMGYQTFPQTLTFVFDDVNNQDLMHSLSLDHFGETLSAPNTQTSRGEDKEIQWYIFIPSAECRERLISVLARQWELLCGRELPLELTG